MNKFMEEAIKEGRKGIIKGHGGPFGAVIVKDGKIIAKGHNMVVKKKNCTLHGEMVAIQRACRKLKSFDLSGTELYSTAEPCPMCLGAIMWANIKKVYIGCLKSDVDKIGFRDEVFHKLMNEGKGVDMEVADREDCLKLFEEYKNLKDKTSY